MEIWQTQPSIWAPSNFFAVTASMFDGVKNECGMDVLQAIMEFAGLFMDDSILIANFMLS